MCIFDKLAKMVETDYLTLAILATLVVFAVNSYTQYNTYTNWIDTKIEYFVLFLLIILGLYMLRKVPYVKSIFSKDEEPNNVPYHVVESQYGDQALLAGYNEDVVPA